MKKTYFLAVILMSFFTMLTSFAGGGDLVEKKISAEALYQEIGLEQYGLGDEAFTKAITGYQVLLDRGQVKNQQYITIIDFSKPTYDKRFYLIDLENKELVVQTYVMHGKNSGRSYMAEDFSNQINSHKSSLGFYITRETYNGRRGYSLRLSGMEDGFNTNAEKRGVVIHGSRYINETRAENGTIKWSEGCPAIPVEDNKEVISKIKYGSVVFVYYPSEDYDQNSPILNS